MNPIEEQKTLMTRRYFLRDSALGAAAFATLTAKGGVASTPNQSAAGKAKLVREVYKEV